MQPFEIFRVGAHTDMHGRTIPFSDRDVAAIAASYDPSLHEAPIVVGHPATDDPAYGWTAALSFEDGKLVATPNQVDDAFGALVAAGRFKKVSASFYMPDSPNNPKPGTYYLRHIGFLGAQPPAVKGLRPIEFAAVEDGVVVFGDFAGGIVARFLRRFREFMIDAHGVEKADAVIPGFDVDMMAEEAARPSESAAAPAFTDLAETFPDTDDNQETDMSDKDETEIAEREAAFAAREEELEKREKSVEAARKTMRIAAATAAVDGHIAAGRVAPGMKDGLVAFCASLDEDQALSFGEGDGAVETDQRGFFESFLNSLPTQIDFKERAGGEEPEFDASDARALADAAIAYREAQRGKGVEISIDAAVRHVKKEAAQ